jgi:predicted MPP superfamily phosphohydrolase
MKLGASAIGLAGLALATDGFAYEPRTPTVTRLDISLARLPAALDGLTIAQLSDFHYSPFSVRAIRRAVEAVNQFKPDLVVLTGDFVTIPVLVDYLHNAKQAARVAEPCAELLAGMSAKLGKYAVLGNHDRDSDPGFITESLQSHGMPVLLNRSTPIESAGARLWLAGVDDMTVGKPDLDAALKGIPSDEPVVLLSHEPDYADAVRSRPVDLQLSGHSHGGQVRLPVIGPPYLPWGAKKYPKGKYQVGRLTLYTNIGLGTIRIPVRINCPPEVTFFTLRARK